MTRAIAGETAMDAAGHEANVARIREWLDAHAGQDLSVTVHTGADSVAIAAGVFLGLQEHPVSKGVFRAQFRDDRRVSLRPYEEKYIAFGSELVGVEVAQGRLILDKGSQTIEISEMDGIRRSDEVSWESTASVPAAPPPPTTVPLQFPAPSAPVPAPPAPVPAVPAAPSPAAAPYGQVFEAHAKAPFYDNSYGSGFAGPVTIRVEQGLVTVTGPRAPKRTLMAMAGWGLGILGAMGLGFGFMVAVNARGDSDMGFAFCLMGLGLLLALPGLGLYVVARSRAMNSSVGSLQFDVRTAEVGPARYDSNLGCLFMLLFTPLIGFVIMLVMGRRIVRLTVPNDRGSGPSRQMVAIKTDSPAESVRLVQALRG